MIKMMTRVTVTVGMMKMVPDQIIPVAELLGGILSINYQSELASRL